MLDSLTTTSTTLSIIDAVDSGNEGLATTLSSTLSTMLTNTTNIDIHISDAYMKSLSNTELAVLEEKVSELEKPKVLSKR